MAQEGSRASAASAPLQMRASQIGTWGKGQEEETGRRTQEGVRPHPAQSCLPALCRRRGPVWAPRWVGSARCHLSGKAGGAVTVEGTDLRGTPSSSSPAAGGSALEGGPQRRHEPTTEHHLPLGSTSFGGRRAGFRSPPSSPWKLRSRTRGSRLSRHAGARAGEGRKN